MTTSRSFAVARPTGVVIPSIIHTCVFYGCGAFWGTPIFETPLFWDVTFWGYPIFWVPPFFGCFQNVSLFGGFRNPSFYPDFEVFFFDPPLKSEHPLYILFYIPRYIFIYPKKEGVYIRNIYPFFLKNTPFFGVFWNVVFCKKWHFLAFPRNTP